MKCRSRPTEQQANQNTTAEPITSARRDAKRNSTGTRISSPPTTHRGVAAAADRSRGAYGFAFVNVVRPHYRIGSVAYTTYDAFARTSSMKVMKWGWVSVALYTGPVALVVYWFSYREPPPNTNEQFVSRAGNRLSARRSIAWLATPRELLSARSSLAACGSRWASM